MTAKSVPGTQSFSRSIGVLRKIADSPRAPSVSELLAATELTRPTLYRILTALESEGLIRCDEQRHYHLGSELIALSRKALADSDVRKLAKPFLESLRDQVEETVHLAIRSGDELVYIDKIENHQVVRMASTIGTRVPFHSSAVGKAFLAAMPKQQADELIERLPMAAITSFTDTSRELLAAEIKLARTQGWVLEKHQNEQGIVCFGAAICDSAGNPVASVSVSIPEYRLDANSERYSAPLVAQVAAISAQLL